MKRMERKVFKLFSHEERVGKGLMVKREKGGRRVKVEGLGEREGKECCRLERGRFEAGRYIRYCKFGSSYVSVRAEANK